MVDHNNTYYYKYANLSDTRVSTIDGKLLNNNLNRAIQGLSYVLGKEWSMEVTHWLLRHIVGICCRYAQYCIFGCILCTL